MNIQKLCRLYGLSPLQTIVPVQPGTAAQVWRMTTADGAFLVRTLAGRDQGDREWAIFRHLAGQGFTQIPAILPTADGTPSAELDGVWYQLQRYCPGAPPDPGQPGIPRAMARLAAQLEHALSSCPTVRFPAEHFDLAKVWTQARQSWSQLSLPLSPEDADWAVEQCLQITDRDAQVIHGDLGPWNLLFTPDRELLVIDFGQARMGDPYFDVASLLGGLVNHAPQERRAKACEEFLDECQLHMPLNLARLRSQLELWVWRGLSQCVCSGPDWAEMAARFYNALTWAKEAL